MTKNKIVIVGNVGFPKTKMSHRNPKCPIEKIKIFGLEKLKIETRRIST